jgi:hypothetical protein
MPVQIRKAERRRAKLRLGLAGPSGSGKTMSALKLAHGIGKKICMIDTERGSGDLYANMFGYDIITLVPPYAPRNYIEAIHAAEEAGYEIIIIDSLSHAWADEGGLLDQADKLGKTSKNSYTVWADLTPQHRSLVNAMLNSPCHIVATVRSKQAYEMEEYTDSHGNKKQKPVKLGLAPVQREGMEYEFTVFMDIDQAHNAKSSKDRTDLFRDRIFTIDEAIGAELLAWLNAGGEDPADVEKERQRQEYAKKLEIKRTLERLGILQATPEANESLIRELTSLELVPENYGQISATLNGLTQADVEIFKALAPDELVSDGKVQDGQPSLPAATDAATGTSEAPVSQEIAQPEAPKQPVDAPGGDEPASAFQVQSIAQMAKQRGIKVEIPKGMTRRQAAEKLNEILKVSDKA